MDVAEDSAGERDVEEQRPVVRRDRGGQRRSMPSPRATIVQRQAQQMVVTRPMPAAAASAAASTARMPSRNGPAPSRQTTTARIAAAPSVGAHAHDTDRPCSCARHGSTSRSACSTVTRELVRPAPGPAGGWHRRRLRPPARRPARTPHRPTRVSHSAARSASAAPSRQGLGRTTTSAPSRRKPATAAPTASGPSRAAGGRHAALVGVERRGDAGVERIRGRELDAADDREREQHRAGRLGADADQPRQLVCGHQVEERGGGDEVGAGEVVRRRARVMSERLVSTMTRAPSAAGRGDVGGGDSRAGRRRGRAGPSAARPGSSGASHRPIAPLPHARSWITRTPVAGRCAADALDEVARPRRGVGGLAQVEPIGADPDLLDGHRAASARTPATTGGRRRPPRERRAPLASGPAQPLPQPGVAQPRPQRAAERGRVAGRDEQPRPDPAGAVAEGLRHSRRPAAATTGRPRASASVTTMP